MNVPTHDSSTLGGDSGACVIDVETGRVIALHFGGHYLKQNYCVAASDLARDGRVVDAGVPFSSKPRTEPDNLVEIWDGVFDATPLDDKVAPPEPETSSGVVAMQTSRGNPNRISIPIEVSIEIGTDQIMFGAGLQSATERPKRKPIHDPDYGTRPGYDRISLENLYPFQDHAILKNWCRYGAVVSTCTTIIFRWPWIAREGWRL